jgi:hypothetical protein
MYSARKLNVQQIIMGIRLHFLTLISQVISNLAAKYEESFAKNI